MSTTLYQYTLSDTLATDCINTRTKLSARTHLLIYTISATSAAAGQPPTADRQLFIQTSTFDEKLKVISAVTFQATNQNAIYPETISIDIHAARRF